MKDKLKESLNAKIDILPSTKFDQTFFQKLENEKSSRSLVNRWLPWAASLSATACVILVALTIHQPASRTFNHREYVDNVLEVEGSIDESLTNEYQTEGSDLTGEAADEI